MSSLDLFSTVEPSAVLDVVGGWSLALTVAQQAELQAKIREGISADAQVALRTGFREQNAWTIVGQFLSMIKIPELSHFLQDEEHLGFVVNKMRAVLECTSDSFSQEVLQNIKKNADAIWLDHLVHCQNILRDGSLLT